MSFRVRLVLILLAFQAVFVGVLVGGNLLVAGRETREIALAELSDGATLLARTLAEPTMFMDLAQIDETLTALAEDGAVSYAAVHDPDGRLLSAAGTPPAQGAAGRIDRALETGRAGAELSDGQFRSFIPLTAADRVVGIFEVHVSTEPLEAFRREFRALNLGLAGVGLVILALSGLVLSGRLTRRLSALAQATRRLAEGDLTARAEVAGNDELARTAERFNRMAEDLAVERARLEKQARQDHLTRIPNRLAFEEFMTGMIDAPGTGRALLLHIDLDDFRKVNDVFGHGAGDMVLREAAKRLAGIFDPGNETDTGEVDRAVGDTRARLPHGPSIAARVGGDEFMAVLPFPDGLDVVAFADALIQALSVPLRLGTEEIAVGASIGIVGLDPAAGESLEEVLHAASTALRAAKAEGRNRAVILDDALRERALADIRIVQEIERGLLAREFIPYFQPQFSLLTGAVTGFELLARWRHPDRGLLPPGAFLGKLHDPGLVERVDRQVRQAALRGYARLLEAFPDLADARLGLNLPQSQLGTRGIVEDLELAIDGYGLSAGNLAIEVLESVLLDDSNRQLQRNMKRFSALGFSVELDDFGTGHSSFSNLMHFRIDRIKIDRSFVADADSDPSRRALLSAMVGVGKTLGIEVLAEGVETPAQLQVLRDLGCDAVQGYLLARPMDIHQLQAWLAAREGSACAVG